MTNSDIEEGLCCMCFGCLVRTGFGVHVVAGCMKIVQRITGLIKVTDFVTPVWISLVRYLCYGFRKVEYIFVCASHLWPYVNICDTKFIPLCRVSKAAQFISEVCVVNPRRVCAARVTVLGLCVCVCVSVCLLLNISL